VWAIVHRVWGVRGFRPLLACYRHFWLLGMGGQGPGRFLIYMALRPMWAAFGLRLTFEGQKPCCTLGFLCSCWRGPLGRSALPKMLTIRAAAVTFSEQCGPPGASPRRTGPQGAVCDRRSHRGWTAGTQADLQGNHSAIDG